MPTFARSPRVTRPAIFQRAQERALDAEDLLRVEALLKRLFHHHNSLAKGADKPSVDYEKSLANDLADCIGFERPFK